MSFPQQFRPAAALLWGLGALSLSASSSAETLPWHPLAPQAPQARARSLRAGRELPRHAGSRRRRSQSSGQVETLRGMPAIFRDSSLPSSAYAAGLVAERGRLQQAPSALLRSPQRLDERLLSLADTPGLDELVVVHIELQEPAEQLPIPVQLDQQIAVGQIQSRSEMADEYRVLMQARRTPVAAVQQPVVDAIDAVEGSILYRCEFGYCLVAKVPAGSLQPLVDAHPEIRRIDPGGSLDDEVVAGQAVTAGTQMNQFLTRGYEGDGITILQLENGTPLSSHKGFKSVPFVPGNSSPSRVLQTFACPVASECSPGSILDDHATRIAGLLIGDLTRGQALVVPPWTNVENLSGYGRQAQLYSYGAQYSSDPEVSAVNMVRALDHMLGNTVDRGRILNMSAGIALDDPNCLGTSALSLRANDLFQAGVPFIKSAGNQGHAGSSCTVSSPGSAIGVFTVGGHGVPADYESDDVGQYEVRTDPLFEDSSRGGQSTPFWPFLALNRTVVDITAPACQDDLFDSFGTYNGNGCGTSYAAATVTGFAAQFMEFYDAEINGQILNTPGLLYANLLLMGDRQTEFGYAYEEFDPQWGAGRLRARMWNDDGMDGPWEWADGWVCVGPQQSATLPLWNGQIVPEEVDNLKVALWWFESLHEEDGGRHDNIDLFAHAVTPLGERITVGADVSFDNKAFVYLSEFEMPAGYEMELEIYGSGVNSSDPSCGVDSIRVYYAYMMEDSARNESLPGVQVVPEGTTVETLPFTFPAPLPVPLLNTRSQLLALGWLLGLVGLVGLRKKKKTKSASAPQARLCHNAEGNRL